MRLISYMALGLGKDKDFFKPWFENECLSTFRSIHYLPRGTSGARSDLLSEDDFKLTTPGHCDSGFITMLTTFGYPGLQVLMDGEYKSIKPLHNGIVVNLGEIFERITNYKVKATSHRVVDIGVERFSSPFFMEPKYSAVIPANVLAPEEEEKQQPIVYGPWLIRNMTNKYAEWQGFLEAAGLQ